MKLLSFLVLPLLWISCNNDPAVADSKAQQVPPLDAAKDSTSVKETSWERYCNNRYGYCIGYPPEWFKAQPESELGDGRVFLDRQGNELLRIYGRNNHDSDLGKIHSLKEQMEEDMQAFLGNASKSSGTTITYRKEGASFTVFSGIKEGKIHYQKTIKAGKDLAFAEFQYPVAEKEKYDAIIVRMAASFH